MIIRLRGGDQHYAWRGRRGDHWRGAAEAEVHQLRQERAASGAAVLARTRRAIGVDRHPANWAR